MNRMTPEAAQYEFIGADDDQVRFGGGDDPRNAMSVGDVFELEDVSIHSWHTKYKFKDVDGWFNSVCFKRVN